MHEVKAAYSVYGQMLRQHVVLAALTRVVPRVNLLVPFEDEEGFFVFPKQESFEERESQR